MNQLCKVCGETAAGFHFGAFTCEGCKSFFGRTYNNISSLGDCKNAGRCIINKKNRTACKSCRLRKCLLVGMSKSGSRYGRRSNWFKIHCLMESGSSLPTEVAAKVGSETSSCGRSSEDEIESNLSNLSTQDRSPLGTSPGLSSPSPRRSSPELAHVDAGAADIANEISMTRMLDPAYLAFYHRLTGVPLPLSDPTTNSISPFLLPRFPAGVGEPDYLVDYSLYGNLRCGFPSYHEFGHTFYTALHRNEGYESVNTPTSPRNKISISQGKRLPDSPLDIPPSKRVKVQNNFEDSYKSDRSSSDGVHRENATASLTDNFCLPVDERPVDLSTKCVLQAVQTTGVPNEDNGTTHLILDLSIKSKTMNDLHNTSVKSSSARDLDTTNCNKLQKDFRNKEKNMRIQRCDQSPSDENQNENETIITDRAVPTIPIGGTDDKPLYPLDLCLKHITSKIFIQNVS